ARPYRERINDPYFEVADLLNLAQIYRKQKKHVQALETAKEARTIADSSQVIAKFENLFLFLAETEEALGHFPEATTYYRLWGIQKDSTYARASSEALAELQVRYDLARHEKENLELKTIRQEQ